MENIYYVYVYLDPRKPGDYNYGEFHFEYEPFYVGKGKDDRDIWHISSNSDNLKFANKIKKIIRETHYWPIIIRYKENMSESGALNLESIMEQAIGRSNIRKGPLTNLIECGHGGCKPKDTYDDVYNALKLEGYTLITPIYRGTKHHIDFICPNGHRHYTTYGTWKRGFRCGMCAKNRPYTYEEIKTSFESAGYVLLSTEYKGANEYLHYICPNGHKHRIKWANWQQGQRCGKCKYGRWHYDGFSYISAQ